MSIAITLHVIAAIVWVGGMFFAVYVLRPAAADLEAADRVALWGRALSSFLPTVWVAVMVLLASGYWMIFFAYGGMGQLPTYLALMHGIGWIMVLIFLHLWFAPYRRFRKALAAGDTAEAGRRLNQVRIMVTINFYIGLINTAIGVSGRYWS